MGHISYTNKYGETIQFKFRRPNTRIDLSGKNIVSINEINNADFITSLELADNDLNSVPDFMDYLT